MNVPRSMAWVLAAALAFPLTGGATTLAQSSSPEAASPVPGSPTPGPVSPAPLDPLADCERYAGLLPATIASGSAEYALEYEAVVGPVEYAPGYPVEPLLAELALEATDFCLLTFGYPSGEPFRSGYLLRFRGADESALLDAYLADMQATSAATGQPVEITRLDISGRPAAQVIFAGFDGATYDTQVGDAIVETVATESLAVDAQDTFTARLFAALPPPGQPLPDLVAPPHSAASPAPSSASPPTGPACLDAASYDLLAAPNFSAMPPEARAALADALAAYDPKDDPEFKGYKKFMKARDRLVEDIRSDKAGAEVDAAGLLWKYRVRRCE